MIPSFKSTLLAIIWLCWFSGCAQDSGRISVEKITANGIQARLIQKAENNDRPLIILVPGSGGSFIPNQALEGLVNGGYNVLSIAYFGKKGLPKEIELVPLEYLEKVVRWAKNKYSNSKIVLLGISKGAEYSTVFASKYDLLDGLICYSPSSFVLPRHVGVKEGEVQRSSWSYKGERVPCAQLAPFKDPAGEVHYKKYIEPIFESKQEFSVSLIRAFFVKCPMLMLSGEDDMVWPSTKMSQLLQFTIKNSESPTSSFKHISYKDCGHQFFWFGDGQPESRPLYQSVNLTGIKKHKFLFGGTDEGTIKAMVDSKKAVFEFLEGM
ncbi:MAG: hypothetical protein MRZ79_27445 [Bacteroidia bacterium]|nr:hypothetical protein [Bacteroidia bacterium]